MIMKNLMFFAALFLMIAAVAQAQTPPENKDKQPRAKQTKNPEHRAELRAYYEKEMYPILKANHEAFDAALPADELEFLKEKRAEHQIINKEQKVIRREMGKAKKEGKTADDIKEAFGTKLDNMKTKRKALYESLQPFIEKNKATIDKYMAELKPQQEKWRADRKAINEKYGFSHEAKPKREDGKNRGEDGKPKAEGSRGGDQKAMRYILWDSEMKKDRNKEGRGEKDKNKGERF